MKKRILFSNFFCALVALFILIGLFTSPRAASAVTPAGKRSLPFDRLDTYLESQIKEKHIPGLSIGVVEGSQVVHLRGFGVADTNGNPVTPQTPFILGSVSKGVTALAVMQLVEAGKLDLGAPVKRYLSWFPWQDITIHHLLNQTSGITTRAGRSMLADASNSSDAIQLYARKMSLEQRQHQAGAGYQYSNANYVILGAVIEVVSGQTYQDYLREHIFEPLDMAHSFASRQSAGSQPVADGHSMVFGRPIPFQAPYPAGNVPCGYLITSAKDMAHYLVAQLNDGVYQGKQIVSAEGLASLHRGAAPMHDGNAYAMGWMTGKVEGLNAVYHMGEVSNYQSITILLPDQKIGLVMLVNVYSAFTNQQISHLAWDGVHILMHQEPVALHTSPMLYVVVGIVVSIIAFTFFVLRWAIQVYRKEWSSRADGRPVQKHWGRWVIPVLLLVGIAFFNLVGFPYLFEIPIPAMLLFAPELAWPVVIAGATAAVGAAAFTLVFFGGAWLAGRMKNE